jgi:uncharacterized protein YbaA (DUF1428 family)
MTYVDGFVAAVPTANRDKYRQHAKDAAVPGRSHPEGHGRCEIVSKSNPVPFDGKGLIYGGFEMIVDV